MELWKVLLTYMFYCGRIWNPAAREAKEGVNLLPPSHGPGAIGDCGAQKNAVLPLPPRTEGITYSVPEHMHSFSFFSVGTKAKDVGIILIKLS